MSNVKIQNHSANVKSNNIRHRAYYFSLDIIKFSGTFPNERIFWIISDQLLRSATSIGANLIEAKSSSSKKDFIKYYDIALKSANETKYWLCLLRDGTMADKRKTATFLNEAEEISKMIAASLLKLKGKKF